MLEVNNLLEINLTSKNYFEEYSINFFQSSNWTEISEQELINSIKDLIYIVRRHSSSIKLDFNIYTDDLGMIKHLLSKRQLKDKKLHNPKLSMRELEVLSLIMKGLTTKEISEQLFVSYETIKSHRKHILEKSGSKNMAQLLNYYHQTFFEK